MIKLRRSLVILDKSVELIFTSGFMWYFFARKHNIHLQALYEVFPFPDNAIFWNPLLPMYSFIKSSIAYV